MAEEKPIIIMKKKGGHGGHHGGAWKVAYADFVTAMMCFFMVMWLINSAEAPTKKSIASYFRRPGLFETGSGTPLLTGGAGILTEGVPPSLKKDRSFNAGANQKVIKKDVTEEEQEEEEKDEPEKLKGEEIDDIEGFIHKEKEKEKPVLPDLKITVPPDVTPSDSV